MEGKGTQLIFRNWFVAVNMWVRRLSFGSPWSLADPRCFKCNEKMKDALEWLGNKGERKEGQIRWEKCEGFGFALLHARPLDEMINPFVLRSTKHYLQRPSRLERSSSMVNDQQRIQLPYNFLPSIYLHISIKRKRLFFSFSAVFVQLLVIRILLILHNMAEKDGFEIK